MANTAPGNWLAIWRLKLPSHVAWHTFVFETLKPRLHDIAELLEVDFAVAVLVGRPDDTVNLGARQLLVAEQTQHVVQLVARYEPVPIAVEDLHPTADSRQ